MAPIIADIERLNERLGGEPFLGKGTVTIAEIRSTSPSLCAVADSATIHLDRRLAATDTLESAVREIEDLPSVKAAGARWSCSTTPCPSWQGLTYPTRKYYPTWLLPEDHPLLAAGVGTYARCSAKRPAVGRWVFSTNGVAVMGMHGIPCIGFGPGNEVVRAHGDRADPGRAPRQGGGLVRGVPGRLRRRRPPVRGTRRPSHPPPFLPSLLLSSPSPPLPDP